MPSEAGLRRPSRSSRFPWYDSLWLQDYESALDLIGRHAPERLDEFVAACSVFVTDPSFETTVIEHLVDDDTLSEIRKVIVGLDPAALELHEARTFRRFVVHDHPYFTALGARYAGLVSAAVGEAVEPAYNFLSLYSSSGLCPVHLDTPQAKWTLDLCVNQPRPWPIQIGRVRPWSVAIGREWGDDWDAAIKADPANEFRGYTVEEGDAIVFAGSSQWHFREPLPSALPGASTDLLFFHYVPAGTRELVEPSTWGERFGVPELDGLGRW